MSLLPSEPVISLTPDTWHHGHGGGFSVSSGLLCVTMSFITTLARRHVSAIVAPVVNDRRRAGLTYNPRPMTRAFRTHGRRLLTGGFKRHCKWTSKDARTVVASVVNER